jgi:hypothetical protein
MFHPEDKRTQLLSLESPVGTELPVLELTASLSSIAALDSSSVQLTSLKLWNNRLGAQGATLLAPTLSQLGSLLSLSIICDNIDVEGVTALGAHITSNNNYKPVLQALDLTHNSLGDQGMKAFAPFLSKLTALQSLCLDGNGITATGMKRLCPCLKKLRHSLRELSLCNNDLGFKGTESLGQVITQLSVLQKLELSRNHSMSVQGAGAIWSHLPRISTLQV